MQTEQLSEDLLIMEDTYERASTGKRLANYIIDLTRWRSYFLKTWDKRGCAVVLVSD